MTNSFLRVSSPVLVVMALLIAGHMAALFLGLPEIYLASKFWMIYLFIIPITLIAIYFIHKSFIKNSKSVAKNFFIYMMVKMIFTFAFLSPWLVWKDEFSRPMVFQFFAIFFPLLFAETFVLVKMLNPKSSEQTK
ncbi:MAG: hypothetical protein HRT57_00300 [Crocinitomicaceae bacterium]|nr:hypothetical protein [Crocinitomicaceae bacterium]